LAYRGNESLPRKRLRPGKLSAEARRRIAFRRARVPSRRGTPSSSNLAVVMASSNVEARRWRGLKCFVHNHRGGLIQQNRNHQRDHAERRRVHDPRVSAGEQRPLRGFDRKRCGAQLFPQSQHHRRAEPDGWPDSEPLRCAQRAQNSADLHPAPLANSLDRRRRIASCQRSTLAAQPQGCESIGFGLFAGAFARGD